MTLLTRNDVSQLLAGDWDAVCPQFDKSLVQLWDEAYEDYISEGGNYRTEDESEEAHYDQEKFASERGMLSFADFLILAHAQKEMKFTDEERQKISQAVRSTEDSMEGLKAERIENLLADWRSERSAMEAELIKLIDFMSVNGSKHADWPNTVKAIFTDYIYTSRMCYRAARMLTYVDTPDEVCVLLRAPMQRPNETVDEYKTRLTAYLASL
jgi:hypothetical protein